MELRNIKGVGDKILQKLNSLGIYSAQDLLDYLPKKYLDMTKISHFDEVVEGENILLKVKITHIPTNKVSKSKRSYLKCDALCDSVPINLIWFNMPYIAKTLSTDDYLVWGQVRFEGKEYSMINPSIAKPADKYKLKGVNPIYSLGGKIGETTYRKIVDNALQMCDIDCLLPSQFNLRQIYQNIHFPQNFEQMQQGQSDLALYRLFSQLLCYRLQRKVVNCSPIICQYPHNVEQILPYKLTQSQRDAILKIIEDFACGSVMNRFVLGDVGSGKTIVAHMAMYMIFCAGHQSVLLAPTEILARQHFDVFCKVFSQFGVRAELLTASTAPSDRLRILQGLTDGDIDVLFSAHSAISDDVKFCNLKLAVIDEAHKFGVGQRAKLLAKGENTHCLLMSATPLPRSFAMLAFGDLTLSKLYKTDSRATNIKTYVLRSNKIADMFAYFARKVSEGERVIVVCPRVDAGDDIYSVKSVHKMLGEKYFAPAEIGLLYGGLSGQDKDKAISDFAAGISKVLVTTSVIEVGIDIKDAHIIAVLGADRFGIAALHQLRGRVGRDGSPSECYLHCASYEIPQRIKSMKDISDGVLLSELDAETRGYGDFIGFNQSGKNEFDGFAVKITMDLIDKAKQLAQDVDVSDIPQELLQEYMNKYAFYKDIILN